MLYEVITATLFNSVFQDCDGFTSIPSTLFSNNTNATSFRNNFVQHTLYEVIRNTLSNKAFSFVVWGICNSGGELSHLMLNKPSNGYSIGSPNDAINDALNYSVYDIPTIFKGTGFLIARFTFT